ncbi:MAG: uracil-DNA glycosylase [Gammaproteobacteria bacterium]
MDATPCFDPDCRRCPRLAGFLDQVRAEHPDYHARPVPAFGDANPRLLIVGLAPGMHGANRTGRPFTGDHAGLLLYRTLYKLGLASHEGSDRVDDGLVLTGCRITNAVKCLPPANKPVGGEIRQCNRFLAAELARLPSGAAVLALGRIAHDAVLKALKLPLASCRFAHGAEHHLGSMFMVDSYHCSRYNTQTRRLTESMFLAVVTQVAAIAGCRPAA